MLSHVPYVGKHGVVGATRVADDWMSMEVLCSRDSAKRNAAGWPHV